MMNQLTQPQLKFLNDYIKGTWTQNPDSSISVKGDVDCSYQNLDAIPVQFSTVSGYFYCNHNQLTSLKGCPSTVSEGFNCSSNQLVTLEFCPSSVGGGFYCYNNPVSEKTLQLLFQARTVQKFSWEQVLVSCFTKIPQEDLELLKLPKDFKEKYRGNIAASNLGLV